MYLGGLDDIVNDATEGCVERVGKIMSIIGISQLTRETVECTPSMKTWEEAEPSA